jgi:hypothetical protein
VGTATVFMKVPLQYTSQAQLVVLSPTKPVVAGAATPSEPTPAVNPFLAFGGSQEVAAQVLLVRMSDDSVGRRLADDGVVGEWKFDIRGGSGPLLQITATEATPEQASASAEKIMTVATNEFARLQRDAGAPDDQQIRVSVVNVPSKAEPVFDGKIRTSVLVAALGLLAAIGVPLSIEGIARARRIEDGTAASDASTLANLTADDAAQEQADDADEEEEDEEDEAVRSNAPDIGAVADLVEEAAKRRATGRAAP